MADRSAAQHDPETWTGGMNLRAAMDQHDRARQTAEDTTIDWLPVIGGGLLAGAGVGRGGGRGLLMTLLGGGLVYWGMSRGVAALPRPSGRSLAPDGERSVRVERVITINRPVAEVYAAWRDVESLPSIMSHLESVTRTDDGLTHWVARAPLGRTVEWDAEIINDEAGRVISWRSVEGASVPNVGAVHFDEAPAGRGTELRVRIEYNPPAGALGATIASLFGEEPSQQVADDLRRFKSFMETGEYPTTDGQPRGAHQQSIMDPILHKVSDVTDAAGTADSR
ncbi:MAG TPA: SRPBCC family protein [Thermomicrobiales bacterium]|nr:SRPBCC family protein [Thermomicrobiales bacterium]